ncbi:MBG domain-containing protein [Dysgonomonas sp. 520]|uniref:MBG domain-containing protein n=1 Tax=Dysgonomonas sp. 520 TaxID=2302931 RepID=UPI0013D5C372|nr:MBG domain-containing protein [Dysgonomonas sp. 520]NDW08472.1 T9SS C-terminal target domain-containing protein [Dysgonomonas sp. 520]
MKKLLLSISLCFLIGGNVVAQTYSGGDGSEDNPFLISSKTDMETLATTVNSGNSYAGKYFLLTKSLTEENDTVTTIVGTSSANCFSGVFDGKEHKIAIRIEMLSNNNIHCGLFGNVRNAHIKNISVIGSISYSSNSYSYVGGICGYAYSSIITNCYNMAIVSYSSSSYYSYAGGICGYANSATIITGCYNTGNISSNSHSNSNYSYAGGICGYVNSSTVTDSHNSGKVSSHSSLAGGICGYTDSATVSNCHNTGNITSTSTTSSYAGGICGNVKSSNVTDCYNTGDVFSSTSYYSSYSFAGGICGAISLSTVINCIAINTTMTAIKTGSNNNLYAGRIIGSNDSVTNCYSLSSMKINEATINSQDTNSKNGKDLHTSSDIFNFIDANKILYLANLLNDVKYGDAVNLNISNLSLTYQISDGNVAEIIGGILKTKKSGFTVITGNYTHNGNNYKIGLDVNVNKKELVVQADTISSIFGNIPLFTCKYDGFVNNEAEEVLTKLPLFSCSGTSTSNVGSYPITLSGAEAENYTFSYKNGLLNILKRDLKVIIDSISRTYGDNNPTLTFSYDEFVNGDTQTRILTKPTITTIATKFSNVGNYEIISTGGNATNYNLVHEVGNLEITKAILTVKPNNASRLYGSPNPEFTFSYSGFKNTDTKEIILKEPEIITEATISSVVGAYPIIGANANAINYDFIYGLGTLNITKAPLVIKADSISIIYGDIPEFTCKYEGFVNSETEDVLITQPSYSCYGTSTSNAGSYIINLSGANAENYSISYKTGLLNILKRNLQVIPDNMTKVYGDNNPTFTLSYEGFVNNNTASNISTKPTVTTAAIRYSDVGKYDIICSNGYAINYNLICEAIGTLTVEKAPLIITANNASRYWGVENPNFTVSYSGFKNSDSKSILTEEPQISCEAIRLSPSGQYPIVVTGGVASNYDLIYKNGTLTINKSLQAAIMGLDYINLNLVSGMESILKLSVEQEDPMMSFQTDITFPTFVEIDINKVSLSNRCDNAHILNVAKISSSVNTYRFMIYSPSNKHINGNTGELISIPFSINWETAPTYYTSCTASTKGASAVFYISEIEKPEKTINNVSKQFYIHEMGDVNINGTITISDIVAEVDYILGKKPNPFLFEAGDMNKNGTISILDLTQLVNVVLTRGSSYVYSMLRSSNSDYELSFSDLSLNYEKGDLTGNLMLSMKNKLPVIALNWDLILPDGVTIDEANLQLQEGRASRATHTIAMNKFDNENRYRFIIYSTQNKAISGNEGELLSIPIKIDENVASGNFEIGAISSNLIYIDNEEQKEAVALNPQSILSISTPSGIDSNQANLVSIYPNPAKDYVSIKSDSKVDRVEIHNLVGKLVFSNTDNLEKIDVSMLPDGTYILRTTINNKIYTHKLIILK